MQTVNMLQAKATLSRLVQAIERGEQQEIVITRHGRPAARLVPIGASSAGPRIGVAKDKFTVPNNIDTHDEDAARLFLGEQPA